ncbi:DNA polymerase III subunit gamma/tau, partial [Patescibacteria group bacterium]|nr:DNA polymerase III subunit gamma/tau [Patescibacteria group bacterium]MBU1970704.1 DNA polymerase III subunit gamma/tau [Patescibacteria group bacterium]
MYYTKYRPQKFDEVQKPNEIADALMQQVKTGKTVHAYLFTGPRGVGKTTMARLLAKGLTCEQVDQAGDVCGECVFCLGVQHGNLLDLTEIDAASNRGIDDIRDLREKVKLLPASAKKKVYIIDEVHMLTTEAFNALLKTLEEPPKHAVFILCTTEAHKVPDTIKSRCQIYKFRRPAKSQIIDKLKRIAETESAAVKLEDAEFERVAILAGGAFRDAENLLQQLIEGGQGNTSHAIGAGYAQFLRGLWEGRAADSLAVITSAFEAGAELAVWTDELLRYLRDILYLQMGFSADYFALNEDELLNRQEIARLVSKDWTVLAIELFNQAQNELKSYAIPQLALEVVIVKLTAGREPVENSPQPTGPKKDIPAVTPPASGQETSRLDNESKPATQKESKAKVSLEAVEQLWQKVVSQVIKMNNSIGALVKSGKPVQVTEDVILLEVAYKFHKERL